MIVLSGLGAHDGVLEATRLTFHIVSGPSATRGAIWPAPGIVDVCATNGTLPVGTRFVEFVLSAQAAASPNDGSADKLEFVLTAKPDPPFAVAACAPAAEAWSVTAPSRTNRTYELERSQDLRLSQWDTTATCTAGTGYPLTLTDTNPPADQAAYRVVSRRP